MGSQVSGKSFPSRTFVINSQKRILILVSVVHLKIYNVINIKNKKHYVNSTLDDVDEEYEVFPSFNPC